MDDKSMLGPQDHSKTFKNNLSTSEKRIEDLGQSDSKDRKNIIYMPRERERILEQIECYILENHLKPNDKLPSEKELCEMWNCNRMTLRASIRRLVIEGKLVNRAGVGNFVAEEKLERYLFDFKSFADSIGRSKDTVSSQLIHLKQIESKKSISQSLHIPLGTPVYELVRLRKVDDIPLSLENIYLPCELYPGLENFNFEKESLYDILESIYKVTLYAGEEEIGTTRTTAMEAQLLNIKEEEPVFFVRGVSWDKNKKPFEYFKSVLRADRLKFATVMQEKY